jgi:PAS domain S-box-containing protein
MGRRRLLLREETKSNRGFSHASIWENPEARRVLDTMTELFFAIDRNYDILFLNRAVLERNKKTAEDYAGKNHWDLWPTMKGTVVEESYKIAFATGVPIRFEHHFEPSDAWVDVNAYPYGDQLHIYFRDITEQRKAEQELVKKEKELRVVLDAIPHIAYSLDMDGRVEYLNARWKEFTGADGMDRESMRRAIHPDDLDRVITIMTRSRRTGKPESYDTRVRTADGEYRWLRVRLEPVKDGNGRTVRWIGTSTDVHDEVLALAALQENQAALRESEERYRLLAESLEKLVQERTSELEHAYEEQESFSYSVSHDLRTPLRSIVSSARILDEDFGANLPLEAKRLLDQQAHAALRLAQLIDDLLELSRVSRKDLTKAQVDLTSLFTNVASFIDKPDNLIVSVQEDLRTNGDPRLLQLVAQNLIENAVKFSPNGGRVIVGRRSDGSFFVSDQGIGFNPLYAPKLFQPFQRLHTEEEFPGTGIGLASVKRIIERHGGQVWAEGEVGKGATFFFTVC